MVKDAANINDDITLVDDFRVPSPHNLPVLELWELLQKHNGQRLVGMESKSTSARFLFFAINKKEFEASKKKGEGKKGVEQCISSMSMG